MTIPNLPVWVFEPNWGSPVSETLEWLTDVLTSVTGSEQRRSIRLFPRTSYEFSIAAEGPERALLDNQLVTYGTSEFHLPLWFDAHFTSADVAAGATAIPCETAGAGQLAAGGLAFIVGPTVFQFEIVEIASLSDGAIALAASVVNPWPLGTRLHPIVRGQFTEQPQLTKRNDRLVTGQVKFRRLDPLIDPGGAIGGGFADTYETFAVLPFPPDESKDLTYDYNRMVEMLDNSSAKAIQSDIAGRAFTVQQYAWLIEGRELHAQFHAMLLQLRGRASAIWIPTFMSDFELHEDAASGDTSISTLFSGFTSSGGPRWDREHIMIETATSRYYRKILNSAIDTVGFEIVYLDTALPVAISMNDVVRISFMTLCRLNQDSVQIDHSTDIEGVSAVQVAFRSAPNTRAVTSAFGG
jgi:hypothetical protein